MPTPPLTTINTSQMRARAQSLQATLDHSFHDPQGLMYAYLNVQTRLPFTQEQLCNHSYQFHEQTGNVDWLSHENTLMVTGNQLSALAWQAKAVGLDSQITKRINRALEGLKRIESFNSPLPNQGWLSKPWGGRASNESSNDQYGCVITGLHDLLTLVPQHPACPDAKNLLMRLCNYWLEHDYVCPFHGNPNHRWMGQSQWGLVCMMFIRVAHEHSGEPRYAVETQRLCDTFHCDQPAPWSGNFLISPFADRPHIGVRRYAAYHHLVCDALDILCDTWPQRGDHWRSLLADFWHKDIAPGQANDGLLHACYEINRNSHAWQPCAYGYLDANGYANNSASPNARSWVGPYKSGSMTCHLASSAIKVARRLPDLEPLCRDAAWRALSVTSESMMVAALDEDLSQQGPSNRPLLAHMLDGRALAQWLTAYWQGSSLGWWD